VARCLATYLPPSLYRHPATLSPPGIARIDGIADISGSVADISDICSLIQSDGGAAVQMKAWKYTARHHRKGLTVSNGKVNEGLSGLIWVHPDDYTALRQHIVILVVRPQRFVKALSYLLVCLGKPALCIVVGLLPRIYYCACYSHLHELGCDNTTATRDVKYSRSAPETRHAEFIYQPFAEKIGAMFFVLLLAPAYLQRIVHGRLLAALRLGLFEFPLKLPSCASLLAFFLRYVSQSTYAKVAAATIQPELTDLALGGSPCIGQRRHWRRTRV
jgi:hypothetical protein